MISKNHLLRRMNVFMAITLADSTSSKGLFYREIGRRSVDPELMIRMLIVGHCYGTRHEHRPCEEVGQRQKRAVAEYLAGVEVEAGSPDKTQGGNGDDSDSRREPRPDRKPPK
jgi:hypothetical protein